MGLAFAALGNLIVEAVPPERTGIASGMNTVMRTLGGAAPPNKRQRRSPQATPL
jgi:hypothetical protein